VIVLLTIIWLVEVVNLFSGHGLFHWGILPRDMSGLIGIVFAPFIHGSLWHAISNTVPLLILGLLASVSQGSRFISMTVIIILFTGIGVWLVGRGVYHVGASGLVFGYFGALLMAAFVDRNMKSLLAALITILLYGGLVFGLLPIASGISVESHLLGFLSGVGYIWITRKRVRHQ